MCLHTVEDKALSENLRSHLAKHQAQTEATLRPVVIRHHTSYRHRALKDYQTAQTKGRSDAISLAVDLLWNQRKLN